MRGVGPFYDVLLVVEGELLSGLFHRMDKEPFERKRGNPAGAVVKQSLQYGDVGSRIRYRVHGEVE